jgi:starch-binding outer membrane protein, SusD/RagB family
MKRYILIWILLLMAGFNGCIDPLDKEPLNLISENVVFEDEALVEAYLLDLYDRVDFQRTGMMNDINMGLIASMGAESQTIGEWQQPAQASLKVYDETGAGWMDYWPYGIIRDVNYFIDEMENSLMDTEYKNQRIAEVRFLRAYMYFDMVKRFGGVPIITEVLSKDDPEEILYPERDTEKDVYDFIASEMDAIVNVLPESYAADDLGRPTKYAALAMKSRTMLYAASIAKFGEVQLDGLVGIPAGEADSYYQKSIEASEAIIDSEVFSLYQKNSDPAQNFQDLFVDESDNPEVIFSERWDADLDKGHSWDVLATPQGFNAAWNSNYYSFVDFIELFDFVDGTSGKLDRSLYDGNHWFSYDEYIGNRDPRFRATFNTIGSTWQGGPAYYHSATWFTDPSSGERKKITGGYVPDSDWPGAAPPRNRNRTGIHVRKRLDEGLSTPEANQSSTDFYVFRYAEILLNYAEAGYYLNRGDAIDKINEVRERAGMPLLTDLTEDKIRQERQVELAYEEHRYWDLRRWRIAVDVLDGVRFQGFKWEYDYDTDKYSMTLVNGESVARVFQPRHYYFALGVERIADNTNLIENPGY